MFFRPSFCANCGEKIERAEWHLWTSRRFCELCATEFRGIDLLPKLAAATGVLGIALGVSGYIGRGQAPNTAPSKPTASLMQRPPGEPALSQTGRELKQTAGSPSPNPVPQANSPQPQVAARLPESVPEKPDGPVYICGAQTKKGTPCSRRVKGNVRCFQHTGMPAMLPPEKLRVG